MKYSNNLFVYKIVMKALARIALNKISLIKEIFTLKSKQKQHIPLIKTNQY